MKQRGLPDPIRDALIRDGLLTPDGLGRAGKLQTCPRCHAWTIRGLDAHICALEVTLDPVRLDPVQELAVILSGRQTYELWGREIERREPNKIRHGMAKPVLPAHLCGTRPPLSPEIIRLWIPGYLKPPQKAVTECPF